LVGDVKCHICSTLDSSVTPLELPCFVDMADYLIYEVSDSDSDVSYVARAEVDRAGTLLCVWFAIWWSMWIVMLYFLLMYNIH
jgi:hypothetical protein